MDIPVIDLFAGPGGLSEGFSRYDAYHGDQEIGFRVKLSIEKDPVAARTLRLRAFVRSFRGRDIPGCYYEYVRASSSEERDRALDELQSLPEWCEAEKEAWNATLGEINPVELHQRIAAAVSDSPLWVLLGGPPCQAYSVAGRARRMGAGGELRAETEEKRLQVLQERAEAFFSDEKHLLYREYLKIVAVHQPPVFVMENVKGILSSKLRNKPIFDQILRDLADPVDALRAEDLDDAVRSLLPRECRGYKIHSFVCGPDLNENYAPKDYLIRSEDYGIPQERHRVILLGVRDDIALLPGRLEPADEDVTIRQVIGDLPRLRSGRSGRVNHKERTDREDTGARWVRAVREAVTPEMLCDVAQGKDLPEVASAMRAALAGLDPALTRGGRFLPGEGWSEDGTGLWNWFADPRIAGVLQHETRDHMDADFARYLFVAAYGAVMKDSPKLRHFPETVLPQHENAQTEEGRRVFHDRFRVQLADRPATTITSHIRKDGHYFIHYDPTQCRSLTVREAARVQTFPDNYFFEGNRTEQYQQVGNAVPPLLATKLARIVADLFKALYRRSEGMQGAPLGAELG